MKIVAGDKNLSVLVQVTEVINLKHKRFFYRTSNVFLNALSFKYFGYTYWLWKTYRQYSQIVIQLGLQFEQGYVRIGVVEAVDMNPLNLYRVTSIPDPVNYHP